MQTTYLSITCPYRPIIWVSHLYTDRLSGYHMPMRTTYLGITSPCKPLTWVSHAHPDHLSVYQCSSRPLIWESYGRADHLFGHRMPMQTAYLVSHAHADHLFGYHMPCACRPLIWVSLACFTTGCLFYNCLQPRAPSEHNIQNTYVSVVVLPNTSTNVFPHILKSGPVSLGRAKNHSLTKNNEFLFFKYLYTFHLMHPIFL